MVVANELAALEPARLAMRAYLESQGVSAAVLYRAELVLEETLMNRLQHAFPQTGRHLTHVELELRPEEIRFLFEDVGQSFDPTTVVPPQRPTRLEDARPGGLGLVLTRKVASSWVYSREGGRNVFTVVLNRT